MELDLSLKRILKLRRDLGSVIIHPKEGYEEEGYEEEVYEGDGSTNAMWFAKHYYVTKSRTVEPDYTWVNEAKKELEEIYPYLDWYRPISKAVTKFSLIKADKILR